MNKLYINTIPDNLEKIYNILNDNNIKIYGVNEFYDDELDRIEDICTSLIFEFNKRIDLINFLYYLRTLIHIPNKSMIETNGKYYLIYKNYDHYKEKSIVNFYKDDEKGYMFNTDNQSVIKIINDLFKFYY